MYDVKQEKDKENMAIFMLMLYKIPICDVYSKAQCKSVDLPAAQGKDYMLFLYIVTWFECWFLEIINK